MSCTPITRAMWPTVGDSRPSIARSSFTAVAPWPMSTVPATQYSGLANDHGTDRSKRHDPGSSGELT
jgi:hypothetical protein